jgi:hypothetical protein
MPAHSYTSPRNKATQDYLTSLHRCDGAGVGGRIFAGGYGVCGTPVGTGVGVVTRLLGRSILLQLCGVTIARNIDNISDRDSAPSRRRIRAT